MTRASLLHILDHVNGISEAEIRELEQLAAAFPYCQTAHVLLAKAAHDRGSMLASQRLRRAATYAADRELLRQLIEQPAPAAADATTAAAPAVETARQEALPAAEVLDLPHITAEEAAPIAENQAIEFESTTSTTEAVFETADVPASPEVVGAAQESEALEEVGPLTADELTEVLPDKLPLPTPEEAPVAESAVASAETEQQLPEENPEAEAAEASFESTEKRPEEPEAASAAAESIDQQVDAEVADELLPAVAPPIRPPVEAGAARFEFGLAETEPESLPVYQLPTLEEDDIAAPPSVAPVPAFQGDASVAYALGGSCLGYCLQSQDAFTQHLPADDFFAPDALLLAHIKAHTPPTRPPSRSSFDLINKFLRAQPRLKAPTPTTPTAEEQADLSVRSTQVAPALASESLAKIMVRQGKIAKAIEIYERLMVRQPEKKAYFADQIQQLKSPE